MNMPSEALNASAADDIGYNSTSDKLEFGSIPHELILSYPDPEVYGLGPGWTTVAPYYHQGQPSRRVPCSPPTPATGFDEHQPLRVNYQHAARREWFFTENEGLPSGSSSPSSVSQLSRTREFTAEHSSDSHPQPTSYGEKRLERKRALSQKRGKTLSTDPN